MKTQTKQPDLSHIRAVGFGFLPKEPEYTQKRLKLLKESYEYFPSKNGNRAKSADKGRA